MYSIILLLCSTPADCRIVVPPPPIGFFTTAAECAEGIRTTQVNLAGREEEVYLAVPACVNWVHAIENLKGGEAL